MQSNEKKFLSTAAVFALSLVFFVLIGEAATRGWHWYRLMTQPAARTADSPLYIDEKLGWGTTANLQMQRLEEGSERNLYTVNYETAEGGFRMFGDPQSLKQRVLIIGDSFTQAIHVSNDKTYYFLIGKHLPVEIFAYGGGGYGTLQEYMILDRHIDRVKPALIIWQYCGNDFINNSFELEQQSRSNNNGMRRPYLSTDGEIFYATPKTFPWLREFAAKHSSFLYLVLSRLDILNVRLAQTSWADSFQSETVEDTIARHGKDHPGFRKAARTTEQIMNKVRQRAAHTPIVAFSSDIESPYYEEFQRISQAVGIELIRGVPEAVRAAEARGITVTAGDRAHWNELGHAIVAKRIGEYLANNLPPLQARH